METAIYRIVQESLTNSAKHAQARRVWVTAHEAEDALFIHIRDDGQGFDAQAVLKTPWQDRGLGLAGMMERASLFGGSVQITSRPGSGTTIDVQFPLVRPALVNRTPATV
jgi:signal transduction histidine kinase